MKSWYHSKMLWANLGALVAAFGFYMEEGDISPLFPAALAVLNIILRLVTKTAIRVG